MKFIREYFRRYRIRQLLQERPARRDAKLDHFDRCRTYRSGDVRVSLICDSSIHPSSLYYVWTVTPMHGYIRVLDKKVSHKAAIRAAKILAGFRLVERTC